MTAEEWSRVRRPLKRPYDGPPVLFRADPKKDPRVSAACADVELEIRNWSSRTRHPFLAWPTVQELTTVTKRSRQSVLGHIQTLCDLHRLISLRGIKALKRWLLEHGPRFGLSWEWYQSTVGRRASNRSRFLVVVGRLPPIADGYQWDSIFPLNLKPSEGQADAEDPRAEVQNTGLVEVQNTGLEAAPLPICLRESTLKIVVEEPLCGETLGDDDGKVCSIPEWLRADLALPQGHRKRVIAERMLQGLQARAGGHQPNPTTRPAPEPLTVVASPPKDAPRARLSDRVHGQAEAIVQAVASGATAPQDGATALGRAVQDCKPETIRTYAAGLTALADGRASLDETLGLVADAFAPGMHSPNRRLSRFLSELSRRAKKPCAGSTRQSSPAHGPIQDLSASLDCTVAK